MRSDTAEVLRKIRQGKSVSEKDLLLKLSNNRTILEHSLHIGRTPNCDKFENTKSLDVIFACNRFDLLKNTTLKTLFRPNPAIYNERYIDTLIRLYKEKKVLNITLYDVFNEYDSLYEVADLYLLYAKHNLLDQLYTLDNRLLLLKTKKRQTVKEKISDFFIPNDYDKEVTLLEILLSKNSKLTADKLIPDRGKANLEVNAILACYDLKYVGSILDYDDNPYIDRLEDSDSIEHERIPIDKTLGGIEIEVKLLQFSKAYPPLDITFGGIIIEDKFEQPRKAYGPIFVAVDGIVAPTKFLKP